MGGLIHFLYTINDKDITGECNQYEHDERSRTKLNFIPSTIHRKEMH